MGNDRSGRKGLTANFGRMDRGGGFDRGGMLQFERPIDRVEDMTALISECTSPKINPAALFQASVGRMIRTFCGGTKP